MDNALKIREPAKVDSKLVVMTAEELAAKKQLENYITVDQPVSDLLIDI